MACDLLDFVSEHMNENELLVKKMTEDKREKVDSAKADMADAEELFLGNTYSRMIFSVDLPSESEESTRFVEHLTASVKEVFGNDAHVAGEMVSTYDLQKTFDTDNTLISRFTIISIFLIVMLVSPFAFSARNSRCGYPRSNMDFYVYLTSDRTDVLYELYHHKLYFDGCNHRLWYPYVNELCSVQTNAR